MEQQQVTEGNKIISEFVGLEWVINDGVNYPKGNHDYTVNLNGELLCQYYGQKNDVFAKGIFKYHSSWDWLMPVVKKFDFLAEDKAIQFSEAYEYWCDKIDDAITRTYEIEPIFKVLVEAIEWYNAQNKPK